MKQETESVKIFPQKSLYHNVHHRPKHMHSDVCGIC